VIYLIKGEISLKKVVNVFEESWKELTKEYSEARMVSTFCSEADVELHLAHKLLNKLPPESVHIEFPIPYEVKRLYSELWGWGRVGAKKCIKPDIAIINPLEPKAFLFAELKFTPIYWSYLPLYLALKKKLGKESVEEVEKGLKRTINYLQRIRQEEPTQQDIEKTYFGLDKQGRTGVEKLIGILNDLESREGETVAGYLCVIDEIYPNIGEILQKAIRKYNPPSRFKILAQHFKVYENLVEILKKL